MYTAFWGLYHVFLVNFFLKQIYSVVICALPICRYHMTPYDRCYGDYALDMSNLSSKFYCNKRSFYVEKMCINSLCDRIFAHILIGICCKYRICKQRVVWCTRLLPMTGLGRLKLCAVFPLWALQAKLFSWLRSLKLKLQKSNMTLAPNFTI